MTFWVPLQRQVSENWWASCPTARRMTSLRDPVPEMYVLCTKWESSSLTAWPFISPPSFGSVPPASRIPIQACSFTYTITVLDHSWYLHQNLPVLCPTDKILESSLEGSYKLYILLFQSMKLDNLLNGHVFLYLNIPNRELVSSTFRHLWLLVISPLYWLKQCFIVSSVHLFWTTLME